jgi:hypothetical protein
MKNKSIIVGILIGFFVSLVNMYFSLPVFLSRGLPSSLISFVLITLFQTIIYSSIGGILFLSIKKKKLKFRYIFLGAVIGIFLIFFIYFPIMVLDFFISPHPKAISTFQSFCYNSPNGLSQSGGMLCNNGIAYTKGPIPLISNIFFFPFTTWSFNAGGYEGDALGAIFYVFLPLYGIFWGGLIGGITGVLISKSRRIKNKN